MGFLVSDKDVFEIKVFVGELGSRVLASVIKSDVVKAFGKKQPNVEEVTFTLKALTYKDNVEATKEAIISGPGDVTIDPVSYRYERFARMLQDWSLADDDGKKVPAKRENVDKLHSAIAEAVLSRLDDILS